MPEVCDEVKIARIMSTNLGRLFLSPNINCPKSDFFEEKLISISWIINSFTKYIFYLDRENHHVS